MGGRKLETEKTFILVDRKGKGRVFWRFLRCTPVFTISVAR